MIIIKTEKEIDLMIHAGKIAVETLNLIEKNIKIGITTKELDQIAASYIKENDCTASFLNYQGYPASICTSVNEEVVHGIPGNRKLKNGDIISIDIGVCYKGIHVDTARTYKVGHVKKEIEDLMKTTNKALHEGIKIIKEGVKLNDVCTTIEKYSSNYGVIRELTGHGVGKEIHEDPYIPNYSNNESNIILKEGMTLAIEPMFNLKRKEVNILEDGWTIVTEDGNPSAHFEHTVLVTKDGYKIITGE